MIAYTWIQNPETDTRWTFMKDFSEKFSEYLDLRENLWTAGANITQDMVTRLGLLECDVVFVHDSDINHDDVQHVFHDPLNYHVVLFSGGCVNHYYSDKCIKVYSNDMEKNFDKFVSNYTKNGKIDLSILLGGWRVYSRIVRDRILDCFYNDNSFKAEPEIPEDKDLELFPDSMEIVLLLLDCDKNNRESLFLKLRNHINNQIISIERQERTAKC